MTAFALGLALRQRRIFSLHKLFAGGVAGVWYDPSDIGSMFQDSAGTIAAAINQPVGKLLDKSGRGNHATQTTGSRRPILRQDSGGRYYLEFDGVDDFLATSAINFAGTDAISLWVGARKLSDAALGVLLELSTNAGANPGAFYALAPQSASPTYRMGSNGSATIATASTSSFSAPHTALITGIADISADQCLLRVNGAQVASSATDQGSGNYGNYPLYIGGRSGGSAPFAGRIYGAVGLGRAATATEIARTEAWLNQRTGAY